MAGDVDRDHRAEVVAGEEVGVVDERVGRVDEHDRRAVDPTQRRLDGVGERDPSRFPAQHERGERLVGVGERIDVEPAERTERVARRRAPARVGFGGAGEVDAAEIGERAPGGGAEVDDVVGELEVHQGRPTVERPTIMRWISMVPDATVAACA